MQPDNSYMSMQTLSGMNTGNGVDGEVQPGKMVDIQVHEGEGIIPNNAMQGLTGEEFQGLVETLSSGDIDKNKFREAIGMPTIQEYQSGGIAYSGVPRTESSRSRGVPDERAEDVEPEPPPTKQEYLQMRWPNYGTSGIQTSTVSRDTSTPAAPTIKVRAPQQETIATSEVQAKEPTIVEPPPTIAAQTIEPQEPIQTQEVQREATPAAPVVKAPTEEIQPQEETVAEEPAKTSQAGEMVRTGLQKILAEAEGVSEVDKKILDFYMQNTDASNAANMRVLESQIAADPEMSEQAKQAAIRGLQREAAAQRSEQVGEFAIGAAERSSQAARDLVTLGQDVRRYEEITKPMSDLEMQDLESKLGSQNWDEIQEMINKNMSLERVNAALAEKGIEPLTSNEYANMRKATTVGERDWERQLDSAALSLSSGDFETAAKTYSELYDGVDYDFSLLETKANAENFQTGLSRMNAYVTAGWDYDEALAAAKEEGMMEIMGIDEGQFAQFYNASRVNALDQEWNEIETSQIYQDMLNSDNPETIQAAEDIKTFFTYAKLGMTDYDALHTYKITGPNEEAVATIYAKNAEEAQKIADGYGEGNTITDTGAVEFVIKEPVEETVAGTEMANAWETFKGTIPGDVNAEELYDSWEAWYKEGNTGSYEDFYESPTGRISSIDVADNKQLLDKENSDILWGVYESDPEAFKTSDYSFELPDSDFLTKNITYKTKGANEMILSKALEDTLKDATGKIVALPDGPTGQLVSVQKNPNSVIITVKKKDGTSEDYVIAAEDPKEGKQYYTKGPAVKPAEAYPQKNEGAYPEKNE